jgi:methionine aminopeptidase
VCTCRDNPPHRTVAENDLLYVDVGPVFDGFEGDVGKTYLLGTDPDKSRLVRDLEAIFHTARGQYQARPGMTGAELYALVSRLSSEAGWLYGNTTAGHLVGPFPHLKVYGDMPANQIRPENHTPMNAASADGLKRHWILEIHLVDSNQTYGGFFEDLLTL